MVRILTLAFLIGANAWAQVVDSPDSESAGSSAEKEGVEGKLDTATTVKMACEDGKEYPKSADFRLLWACKLKVRWSGQMDGSADSAGKKVTYSATRLVIHREGMLDPVFAKKLPDGIYSLVLESGEWFGSNRFAYGKAYEIVVEYSVKNAAGEVIATYPAVAFSFTPVKHRPAFQISGKVFTAWQLARDEAGDRSFIVPGLSLGGAIRYEEDFDDRDVIALRAVFAVGPNLVPQTTISKDDMGNIVAVSSPTRIQVLAGGELVIGRYISLGAIWVVFGSNASPTPMLLLTYGELYPAAYSTK